MVARGRPRQRQAPGRIWNPPLRRRGRACPARNLPRKRAPTYSRGRGMPRPYKATRKRVVIQSSAVHGRFVGEGLDPPRALMVPQTSAERSRPLPTMLSVGAGHARPGGVWQTGVYGKAAGGACPAPTSPLKLKLHLFRQVCRGRIYASRAGYPLYRMIGTAAAGGIYAAPTSQPILFILVYGRGRGMPRPYRHPLAPSCEGAFCYAIQ